MLSVCMIAKDESRWIGGCIDHLKPIAKEFIVVDTGSTDDSAQIARDRGARVSKFDWTGDFAAARNASLDKATQPWVLIIDPDERIAESDLSKLLDLTKNKEVMAYTFDTRNYSENAQASGFKPCEGEYPDEEQMYPGYFESRKIRLFQNIPTIRFQGRVHELVEQSIEGKVEESAIPFHHFGSTEEVKTEKNKTEFYEAQSLQKAKEEPENWKAHFELGLEWLGQQEFKKAAECLDKARNLKPREALVLSNLGYAYMESGRHDEAEAVLRECLKADPKNHDALLNLGVTEMRRKDYEKALQCFDRLVKIHPKSFLAFRNAGNSYARLNKLKPAAACFEHALKLFPDFHEARVDLGVILFAAGQLDSAEKILNQVLERGSESLRAKAVLDEIAELRKKIQQKKS